MINCIYLNKQDKEAWLPKLFDLLYDNMRSIAPSELSYAEEKKQWLAAVSPAMDKAPRQIILCFVDDHLAGYIQYYTREKLLMVEEVQIKKAYQRTFVFYRLCKHLISNLPTGIEYLEAYADKRNFNSIKLMDKLGMRQIEEAEDSPFVHLRGCTAQMKKYFR